MGLKSEIGKDSQTDEYLDIVDKDDRVVGKMKRSEVHSKNLSNFRIINAFIVNSKGQIWIPRRAKNKKLFPLYLDASMAGHVKSGETYNKTFRRELKEELNMDADKIEFRSLGKTTPYANSTSCFSSVYEIKSDDTPNYNKNDFIEYFWFTPNEVLKKIEKGDKAKSDLSKLIKIFYLTR